ncbi:hypothetical protein F4820DRAFT_450594 [Hypoxylon rubiginosum]|uniref:Uncharacterized protein n=1 Tax=Hypoxylon rubiginosum TaxID=110542 RepID=A0ACB9YV22_9PEZI|nr:hypothetical protein F4820DRAFT_450594 [Hypoxylon rubiginosum]
MTGETVKNLFGGTIDPRNRKLSAVGGSGGEPALVTFGGSIRHSASYTGLRRCNHALGQRADLPRIFGCL